MRDLKFALRMLARTPFITAVAIMSLALGIGANAAIYSMFDQMLVQSLPVDAPDRLVNFSAPGPKFGSTSCGNAGGCEDVFSYPMFIDLQESGSGFEGIAAHVGFGANLSAEGQTVAAEGMLVSGSYFPLLGVTPAMGRLLQPADDAVPGQNFVTVLGWNYWQNQLGGDPSVLNTSMVINGQNMTVVGIAPRGFDGTTLGSQPDVYVPISMRGQMNPGWEGFENRRSYWAYLFGRLAPGATVEQAGAELNTVYRGIIQEVEAPLQEGVSDQTMQRFRAREIEFAEGQRGQSSLHSEVKTPLLLLMVITGLVLLIACANVANLLLARGAKRAQEMAIRGSIGATRGQLLRQLLVESSLLALLGGIVSLGVAYGTLVSIARILPPEAAALLELTIRPSVILFTAAISLGTGLIFGLYPAVHSTRMDLSSVLKDSTGQPSGSRGAARFRTGLVTAQIAVSMMLLATAGLFIRSLANLSRVDLGLQTDNMITFSISPELNGYEPAGSLALFQQVEEGLAAIPGVTAVSAAMVPALGGSSWGTNVEVEGFESGPDIDSNSRYNAVGPGYFATLGTPLLAGREFAAGDDADQPGVAIVNEAFTRKFGLPGREAVGMRMSTGGDELDIEIIGVVQDAKYAEVKDEIPPLFFLPYRQDDNLGFLNFYVRTGVTPESIMRSAPQVVAGLDANLPVEELKTMEQQVRESLLLDRLIGTLSMAFAALATLLAGVGLYGVLSYTVAQRTREIGLRMALGAAAGRVRGMVLRQVGWMVGIGALVGGAAAVLLGRYAGSLLYELQTFDPLVLSVVAILLAAVSLMAGFLPAHRASKVDPMEALRYE